MILFTVSNKISQENYIKMMTTRITQFTLTRTLHHE